MDVLFLSVSIGYGHHKAAEAVMEVLNKRYPSAKIRIVDTLKYINPILDKLVVRGYLNTLKISPLLFKKIYELTDDSDDSGDIGKKINRFLAFRIRRLIEEFKPSIIVCTHPFGLQMLHSLRKRGMSNIPVVGIITDFTAHGFWIEQNIDAYIVATELIKYDLIKKGVPSKSIYPLGIPVDESFTKQANRSQILKEFNLDDKMTALVMGGSLGMGQLKSIVGNLAESSEDLQLIVVAGKNEKLRREIEKFSKISKKRIVVLGFTQRVSDLMDISDFIITKPGGMTVSEAICKELPIIILSPIPGHEENNARFIINNGLGAWIFKDCDIDTIVKAIVSNPLRIKQLKEMARYFARPFAASHTVDLLESIVNDSK